MRVDSLNSAQFLWATADRVQLAGRLKQYRRTAVKDSGRLTVETTQTADNIIYASLEE